MSALISDEALTLLLPVAVTSPIAVGAFAGWGWAGLYVAVALVVAAVAYVVSSARSRRAFRRFLWRHLPRGRRHLPRATRPASTPTREETSA